MTVPGRRSARAIVLAEGRLLLIRREREALSYFVLPGGGIEPGETSEQACARELREETTLEASAVTLVSTSDAVDLFRVEDWAGIPRLGGVESARQAPDNRYELVWVAVEDLADLPFQPAALKPIVLAVVTSPG